MEKKVNATFEDGLMLCMDILEATEDHDKALDKINKVLRVFREVMYLKKKEALRNELGIHL